MRHHDDEWSVTAEIEADARDWVDLEHDTAMEMAEWENDTEQDDTPIDWEPW